MLCKVVVKIRGSSAGFVLRGSIDPAGPICQARNGRQKPTPPPVSTKPAEDPIRHKIPLKFTNRLENVERGERRGAGTTEALRSRWSGCRAAPQRVPRRAALLYRAAPGYAPPRGGRPPAATSPQQPAARAATTRATARAYPRTVPPLPMLADSPSSVAHSPWPPVPRRWGVAPAHLRRTSPATPQARHVGIALFDGGDIPRSTNNTGGAAGGYLR